ncbi:hypothetical protein DEO72_LG7g1795 [Vigna unguiculata]|uniref:Secreted protein n=1 Tax=Vigna unguiculata TaxID=3917 RepID=A0A4D6ML52_VIGUN|nr:hypothetical protein DEO72_LG7g1795 [Vigna unguiculata]
MRSCLVTVACCFCALRLLASLCEVAYEVTPSLCRPHCPSLVHFLHLKEQLIKQVLAFFAGALLEKQIVFVCSNLVCLVAQLNSFCRSHFPTFTVTVRRVYEVVAPCEVAAVTMRSCLVTVACCFCALRLLASLCEVAYEVTPSLCRPHCPSLVHFLHLKEQLIKQVLAFFAGALLEKQIVFVCSNLVCLVAQLNGKEMGDERKSGF